LGNQALWHAPPIAFMKRLNGTQIPCPFVAEVCQEHAGFLGGGRQNESGYRFARSFQAQRQARKNRFSVEDGKLMKSSIRFLTCMMSIRTSDRLSRLTQARPRV
jgi:hypothetical protein